MKAIKLYDKIQEAICFLLGLFIIVDVILQVVTRILPFQALSWTVEMGEMLLAALVWIAISAGVADKSHINVDVFTRKLSPRKQKSLENINNIIFIVFLVFVSIYTIQMMKQYIKYETMNLMLGVNQMWTRLPIVIGSCFGIIRLIVQIILNRKELKQTKHDALNAQKIEGA